MILKNCKDALVAQSKFRLASSETSFAGLASSFLYLLNSAKAKFADGLRLPKQIVRFGTD